MVDPLIITITSPFLEFSIQYMRNRCLYGKKTGKKEDGTPLTDEDKFDILVNTIYENTKVNEPEFVKRYKEAYQVDGFDHNKFLKDNLSEARNFELPSKEYIQLKYKSVKNEDGSRKYSDEQIDQYFQNKTEIEVDQIAKQLQEVVQQNKDLAEGLLALDNYTRHHKNKISQ